MTRSFDFAKKKPLRLSQRVFDIKSADSGLINFGGYRDPSLPKLKSVWVKKSVSVKIGKFIKIGIGMLFLLEEKIGIGIGMLFTLQNRYRYRQG